MTVTYHEETHHSKMLLLLLLSLHMALKHAIKQPRHWSIAWSVKLCWLLTTFQSDAISGHQRPSLVSDKQVFLRDGFNRSPGADALVSFSCSQGWKWMVHTTVMSSCLYSCCRHLSSCWRLLFSSAPRVHKSTKLLRHKTPDFTPDVPVDQNSVL